MNRLLADVGMPQSAAASGVPSIGHGQRVVPGPEIHVDLEFGDGLRPGVSKPWGGAFRHRCIIWCPVVRGVHIFQMHPNRPWGGGCLETGVYWRYDLTTDKHDFVVPVGQ